MDTRNIEISFIQARNWYRDSNEELRSLALQAYTKEELEASSYMDIHSLGDACEVLNINATDVKQTWLIIKTHAGLATAALFELKIIVKALNSKNPISFADEPEIGYLHYPRIVLTTNESSSLPKLGIVKYHNQEYIVTYTIDVCSQIFYGAGCFTDDKTEANPNLDASILCCANKDIAEYLASQFGMLIVTALCGDYVDNIIYPK